ncbi:MAG: FAA hydrolase family protein [Chlorobiaceae bacterium]|nr:FAA hydrolase family protein [Chlorobiaceae bacterium]
MKKIKLKNCNKEFTIGKIVCIGRNYLEHIKELGNEISEKPVIFLKPSSALIFSGEKILHPTFSENMHHEIELVLLIGNRIKNASLQEAEESIIGYAVGLDMTLRDLQDKLKSKGHPWTIAKCFDTSAVVSEFISKEDYQITLEEKISLKVNDVIKQDEKLNLMMFKPAEIVEYLSTFMTLEEGDLIFTGTPKGVGKVVRGDKLVGSIDNIGRLEVTVE